MGYGILSQAIYIILNAYRDHARISPEPHIRSFRRSYSYFTIGRSRIQGDSGRHRHDRLATIRRATVCDIEGWIFTSN